MAHQDEGHYSKKHTSQEKPHAEAAEKIRRVLKGDSLPCAAAFSIAAECDISADEMGKTLDLLEVRLSRCQCGMFGYPEPDKKRIKALTEMPPGLEDEIRQAVYNDAVPCVDVWKMAEKLNISKLIAACGCETLGFRIKPCQLGSF